MRTTNLDHDFHDLEDKRIVDDIFYYAPYSSKYDFVSPFGDKIFVEFNAIRVETISGESFEAAIDDQVFFGRYDMKPMAQNGSSSTMVFTACRDVSRSVLHKIHWKLGNDYTS